MVITASKSIENQIERIQDLVLDNPKIGNKLCYFIPSKRVSFVKNHIYELKPAAVYIFSGLKG